MKWLEKRHFQETKVEKSLMANKNFAFFLLPLQKEIGFLKPPPLENVAIVPPQQIIVHPSTRTWPRADIGSQPNQFWVRSSCHHTKKLKTSLSHVTKWTMYFNFCHIPCISRGEHACRWWWVLTTSVIRQRMVIFAPSSIPGLREWLGLTRSEAALKIHLIIGSYQGQISQIYNF